MRTIKTPDGRHMKFFVPDTSLIKVFDGEYKGQKVRMARVPITSEAVDRDEDNFSGDGVKRMVDQLASGKTPFYVDHGLDDSGFHTYRLADMAGAWVKGEIDDGTGFGVVAFEPGHEKGEMVASKLEKGMPVGFSVGFIPRSAEPRKDENGNELGGRTFHDADLLEVSAVGIPSNPDAVVGMALMAKRQGLTHEDLEKAIKQYVSNREDDTMTDTKKGEGEGTEGDSTKGGMTPDEFRSILEEKNQELADAILSGIGENIAEPVAEAVGQSTRAALVEAGLLKQEDDDDDDEGEDEDDDKSAKSNGKGKAKGSGAKPRGMVNVDTGDGEDKDPDLVEARGIPLPFGGGA